MSNKTEKWKYWITYECFGWFYLLHTHFLLESIQRSLAFEKESIPFFYSLLFKFYLWFIFFLRFCLPIHFNSSLLKLMINLNIIIYYYPFTFSVCMFLVGCRLYSLNLFLNVFSYFTGMILLFVLLKTNLSTAPPKFFYFLCK